MSLDDAGGAAAATEQKPTDTGAQAAPDARQAQDTGADQGKKPEQLSLGEGGGGADEKAKVDPKWRDDWRDVMAGGDEEFRKVLNRFQSPEGVAKSFRDAHKKISAGQIKEPLPEKPTDEQLAAWRKDNGIPEKAESYEIKTESGYVFGDDDQPMIDSFKAFAHSKNWSPQQVNQGAEFVALLTEQRIAKQQEDDIAFQTESQDRLREEWGADYRRNINTMENFLASHAPQGLGAKLMGGRLADGTKIGDNPEVLAFMLRAAMDANPASTVVPAGTSDAGKAITEEAAGLKQMMRDEPDKFYKSEGGKHERRYLELLQVQEKMKNRT